MFQFDPAIKQIYNYKDYSPGPAIIIMTEGGICVTSFVNGEYGPIIEAYTDRKITVGMFKNQKG